MKKRTLKIKQKKEELADSYKKLEYLNTQINEMNKVLDINVYKLKREVVDTQKTVILEKSVDYDAFIKAFPSDLTCNRYLSEKKWGNGFTCKKCGNDKASKTSNSEQKKCTKCDTIESLTAGTIFHRLRFPIQKAFYISIVTFKNHSVSNKDLAEKLEIGENTISSFRKKVKDKMAEENPINFEELIF